MKYYVVKRYKYSDFTSIIGEYDNIKEAEGLMNEENKRQNDLRSVYKMYRDKFDINSVGEDFESYSYEIIEEILQKMGLRYRYDDVIYFQEQDDFDVIVDFDGYDVMQSTYYHKDKKSTVNLNLSYRDGNYTVEIIEDGDKIYEVFAYGGPAADMVYEKIDELVANGYIKVIEE